MAKAEIDKSEMKMMECLHCHNTAWHNFAWKAFTGNGGWRCTKCGGLSPTK